MAIKIPKRDYVVTDVPAAGNMEYACGKIEDSPSIDGGVSSGDAVYLNSGTWEQCVGSEATAIYDGTNPVPSGHIMTTTGLTAYAKYYIHASGGVSTTVSPTEAGIALSATALLVNIKPSLEQATRSITTETYTLILDDKDYLISGSYATEQTITIPLNSSVAFPIGTIISFVQAGAGTLTIAGASGVTVNADSLSTSVQWKTGLATKTGTNTWFVIMT